MKKVFCVLLLFCIETRQGCEDFERGAKVRRGEENNLKTRSTNPLHLLSHEMKDSPSLLLHHSYTAIHQKHRFCTRKLCVIGEVTISGSFDSNKNYYARVAAACKMQKINNKVI